MSRKLRAPLGKAKADNQRKDQVSSPRLPRNGGSSPSQSTSRRQPRALRAAADNPMGLKSPASPPAGARQARTVRRMQRVRYNEGLCAAARQSRQIPFQSYL